MYDIIIRNCSLLMPDFSVKENQDILIKDSVIAQIRDTAETGEAKETIDGKGKLAMPGLIDGHTHTCRSIGLF